jgi:phosphoribosylformylglycinamidine synthase
VIHGLVRGLPPQLDLSLERALQRLLVRGVSGGLIRSAHDCAEGGLAVTLAECCFDTGLGATVEIPPLEAASGFGDIATLFGESASRAIVSVADDRTGEILALAGEFGVPVRVIGRVGGDRIRISIAERVAVDEGLADAQRVWSDAIGSYFESHRAVA